MPYMPATSTEELHVPYLQDLTSFPVEIAIVPVADGEPGDDDYHPATWEGAEAVLLIGAGTPVALAPGAYVVWTRLTAGAERPVRRSGILTVGGP
ncbi:hypothetical protein [Nonomuraea rhodomycinica]|uniref:Uncharacterized protein n=1 Tax=Nonomuraea rhodomycinica TaxID=1712872 RepID=A0A7Y6IW94_9ACTN|nr:hypothetical protein [Nonomuraea rhodomycinica]NUW45554.1 hypothetical protein [Nonomuraea rhodomycinica]